MERYAIRAAKYAVYLVILLVVLLSVMNLIQSGGLPLDEMLFSTRGLMLLAVVVVFALIYPFFGFTKRTLTFDASKKVDDVKNVMSMCGFAPTADSTAEVQKFRAVAKSKKMVLMYEDEIVIATVNGLSTINGARREVVKASFRFSTYIG